MALRAPSLPPHRREPWCAYIRTYAPGEQGL